MARLSIQLLGAFQAALNGEPVTGFESAKTRALLAYLAVESDLAHTRQKLAGLLWPDRPERNSRQSLSQALSNLRSVLGEAIAPRPFLVVDREAIQFDPCSDHLLDVREFTKLLNECESHQHAMPETCDPCLAQLEQALALCRGRFLEGFSLPDSGPFEEWALLEGERLQRLEIQALRMAGEWLAARGEHARAIENVERWAQLEPWDEEARRRLMRSLWQDGRRGAALRQFRECERVLGEELGLSPSEETVRLYEGIRRAPVATTAAAVTGPAARHNLPAQATPFVGRQPMVADIVSRLQDPACRLLSLVGPGGCGKTRLAIEAASDLSDQFPDGVWFASLAGVESASGIVPTVAHALGVRFHGGGDPQAQLLAYLSRRRLLLVLDNCEHLLGASAGNPADVASLVTAILDAAPGASLLATSRAALRVQREQRYPVPGMHHPPRTTAQATTLHADEALEFSAVRLFVERARRTDPSFTLADHNLEGVVRICRSVAGMPLGVVLASAWVRMLTPEEIADQLEAGLDLLETDLRDVPPRQRSMRAVFDNSWTLLTPPHRAIMQSLSVFRGGFDPEAASCVAGASLMDLRDLVDRSLVNPRPEGRYDLHELLRQYAAEKLSQVAGTADARDRHAQHFSSAAGNWGSDQRGPSQLEALREMDQDIDNVRAAWDWSAQQLAVPWLAQATDGLGSYYERRTRVQEGEAAFRYAVACLADGGELSPGAPPQTLTAAARMLGYQAGFQNELGLRHSERQVLDQGLELLRRARERGGDTRTAEAFLRMRAAALERQCGDSEFRQSLERGLALAQSAGDPSLVADLLGSQADVDLWTGEYDEAKRKLRACVAIGQQMADERLTAASRIWLAWIDVQQGRVEEGAALARDAHRALLATGCPRLAIAGHLVLAGALAYGGKPGAAVHQLEERQAKFDDLGLDHSFGLAILGWAELLSGYYDRARRHLLEALAMTDRETETLVPAMCELELARLDLLKDAFPEANRRLADCVAGFSAYTVADYVARAHATRAIAVAGLGDLHQARGLLRLALSWVVDRGSFLALVEALPAAAYVLSKAGEVDRAVEVISVARSLPAVANSPWYGEVIGRRVDEEARAHLTPAVFAAARERGRLADTHAMSRQLAAEFRAK